MDGFHESVNQGAGECVRDRARANGAESFRFSEELGHKDAFLKFSRKRP